MLTSEDQSSHSVIAAEEFKCISRFINGTDVKVLDISTGDGRLAGVMREKGFTVDSLPYHDLPRAVDLSKGLPEPMSSTSYALITSFARMHHLAPTPSLLPEGLLADITRSAQYGAVFCIQDVPSLERARALSDSPSVCQAAIKTALFFEEVVDRFSLPEHSADNGAEQSGHLGVYINLPEVAAQLRMYGWELQHLEMVHCPWVFPSREKAVDYVKGIFDLDPKFEPLWRPRIEELLQMSGQEVKMDWALDFGQFKKLENLNKKKSDV